MEVLVDTVDVQAVDGPVQAAHDLRGRLRAVEGEGPQQPAQLTHVRGSGDVVTGHVADDQRGASVGEDDGVVPVPAHGLPRRGRDVARPQLEVIRFGQTGQQ